MCQRIFGLDAWKSSPNLKVLRNFNKYLKNYFTLFFWHEIGGRVFAGGNMYAYVFILLSLKIVALFYLFSDSSLEINMEIS